MIDGAEVLIRVEWEISCWNGCRRCKYKLLHTFIIIFKVGLISKIKHSSKLLWGTKITFENIIGIDHVNHDTSSIWYRNSRSYIQNYCILCVQWNMIRCFKSRYCYQSCRRMVNKLYQSKNSI